jgi:hypothetical protein
MRMPRLADPIRSIFADERFWLAVYLATASIASFNCVERRCNNFLIFRAAFDHVRLGVDLYSLHPAEHADLFKYSPTFALLFAPFARLPFGIAITSWNLLSALLVFGSLRAALPATERLPAIQLASLGLILTIDGTQTNALIAALMVIAFAALERDRIAMAAVAIAAGTLIKLFPAAALALAVPRRDRLRLASVFALVFVALIALPLLVTSLPTLVAQYRSWYAMGSVDALDRGASMMRLLHDLVGYSGPNWPIQVLGTLVVLLPLVRGAWSDPGRRASFLGSLLVYAVIFNHKAEQPSFIIALVGVAIWYATGPRNAAKSLATAAVFVATVPVFVWVAAPALGDVLIPLEIAAFACSVAWLTMQAELLDLVPVTTATLATPEMQPAE